MPDDNQLIFDFMKDFENENLEATDTPDNPAENAKAVQQETTVSPKSACPQNQEVQAVQQINQPANNNHMKDFENENLEAANNFDNPAENAKAVQQETTISTESVCPQSQEVQAVQQINQPADNNQQFSLAASVINAMTYGNCIGKHIQIPNYPLYAKVICDENYNPYLGIPNQQTNQYEACGAIVFENSEYAVYKEWQKIGTLRYNLLEDSVWQFVPIGMNVPNQGHNAQYPAQNNQQIKYTFNNVPPEHAENIVNSVMGTNPQNNVEVNVNFASSALKSGSPFIPVDEWKAIIDILPE